MEDQDEIVRSLAEYHGHSEEDAFAARDLLRLSPEDFVVRFAEVARFAKDVRVEHPIACRVRRRDRNRDRAMAAALRAHARGVQTIHEAEERLARGGDWARTILVLLDEVESLRGTSSSPGRDADDVGS